MLQAITGHAAPASSNAAHDTFSRVEAGVVGAASAVQPRLVFFVNDSYFAFLLAEQVLMRYHDGVALIVFSTKNKGSPARMWSIFRQANVHYFLYRSAV